MRINREILKAVRDAMNEDLPEDTNKFYKIKCNIENGSRVWWYYEEDIKYAEQCGETPRDNAPFSGIAVALPGQEYRGSIEEEIIIIVDTEPVEKCYPEIGWIALNRLVDQNNLIEVFTK